jgi:hypothetical protein
MKTDLIIIPDVRDNFDDFKKSITSGIKEPWRVQEEVHTPFALEPGEQLVVAVTKFTPGHYIADVTYTILPLDVIDQMRAGKSTIPLKGELPVEVPAADTVPASVIIAVDPTVEVEVVPATESEAVEPIEAATEVTTTTEPETEVSSTPTE